MFLSQSQYLSLSLYLSNLRTRPARRRGLLGRWNLIRRTRPEHVLKSLTEETIKPIVACNPYSLAVVFEEEKTYFYRALTNPPTSLSFVDIDKKVVFGCFFPTTLRSFTELENNMTFSADVN